MTPTTNITLTDAIYWAHFPPQVQALQGETDSPAKDLQAAQLATQGFIIDVPIMVWGWDPLKVMEMRQAFGFTWVPSALQPNINVAPGVTEPGSPSYDPNKPPPGSIKVSTSAADYPPYVSPAPPPTPAPLPLVGQCWGNICALGTGFPQGNFTQGYEVTQNGVTYQLNVQQTPFGPTRWLSPVTT